MHDAKINIDDETSMMTHGSYREEDILGKS
jgi:hypothetical protein